MKKIIPYTGDYFTFFKEVLARKRAQKDLITPNVIKQVKTAYQRYSLLFHERRLASLSPQSFTKETKDQLEGLYSYKAKKLAELRGEIVNNNPSSVCPCCTIASEADTLDHIVPKSEFQEFAVHPLNLIPCCSVCNEKKGSKWRENGQLTILNLYQDNIPTDRFLFVTLTIEENIPIAIFSISNPNGINPELYQRIYNHYTSLNLCKRFQEAAIHYFGEINTIFSALTTYPDEELMQILRKMAQTYIRKEGNNYWVGILYEACAQRKDIVKILRQPQKLRDVQ